jgi:amidase
MTIKEAFDVAGWPTTWGDPAKAGHRPSKNATVVDRLTGAGAVIFGKTNVPLMLSDWQCFNAIYGTTRNPWNLARTPGGSSGGAAAALATGMSAAEFGSDIGGSIRIPAHYCGVFGHKPSYKLVPMGGHTYPGVLGEADLCVSGPLARSAGDLALLLEITAGPSVEDEPAWRLSLPQARKGDLRDFRVALIDTAEPAPVDGAYRALIRALANQLAEAGVQVDIGAFPDVAPTRLNEIYIQLLRAVTTAFQPEPAHEAALRRAEELTPDDRSYSAAVLRATVQRHRDWLHANEERRRIALAFARFFETYDVLLCPAAVSTAFPLDEDRPREARRLTINGETRDYNEQLFWAGVASLTHLPSTVAPIGLDGEGLPAGIQIVGRYLDDHTTIAFAGALSELIEPQLPPGYF